MADQPKSRVHTLPLRWRLLAVSLSLILVALTLTVAVVGVLLNRFLLTQAEQELNVYASSIARLQLDETAATGDQLPSGFTLRFFPADGSPTISSDAVTEPTHADIARMPPTDPRVASDDAFTVPSTDGSMEWLALAQRTTKPAGVVVVALPLRSLHATVTQFLGYAVGIGAVVLLACAWVGRWLIERTFRPLRRIEDTAASIAAGDLTQRVQVPDSADEVTSLSRSINAMLARIERSFTIREANEEKMRQFIADASHELRTPLAAVSGYAELYRQGALVDAGSVTGAMARIEGESQRMSRLVEDLLTLARLDNERPLDLTDVDLAVLAADAAQDARTIDPDRVVTVSGIGGPIRPTELVADEPQLRQVVTNLLTNARVHTPPDTPIEILVGALSPDRVALHVRDHGAGLSAQEATVVFERFTRADGSRSRRGGGGNGLGLAIVAAIVSAHRGEVRVQDTPGGGATFVLELPTRHH